MSPKEILTSIKTAMDGERGKSGAKVVLQATFWRQLGDVAYATADWLDRVRSILGIALDPGAVAPLTGMVGCSENAVKTEDFYKLIKSDKWPLDQRAFGEFLLAKFREGYRMCLERNSMSIYNPHTKQVDVRFY